MCTHLVVINKARRFFKAGYKTALLFVRKEWQNLGRRSQIRTLTQKEGVGNPQASPVRRNGAGACPSQPSSWLQSRMTFQGAGGGIQARGLQGFFKCSWKGSHAPQISTAVQLTFQKPRLKGTPLRQSQLHQRSMAQHSTVCTDPLYVTLKHPGIIAHFTGPITKT